MPTAIADITEPIPSYPSDPGYPTIEIPTTKVLSDDDAARDAPLLLGMALPATPRFAVVKPPITLRPTPTSRPHRDHDGAPTTHPATISTTPIASSRPESPTPALTRAAP